MPLYEVSSQGLIAFRQLRGAGLYESEIEELLWANLDDLTGEVLFPIRRQPQIAGGGRPDIVALDRSGAVVVIEVKRDVDRSQLAQCLEYAGWARTTNLDELAGLFHRGAEQFWRDWQEFTDTSEPVRVARNPRLILVARDFHGRTNSALTFLLDNGLPITVLQVSLYEDINGRRFLDIEGAEEPAVIGEATTSSTIRISRPNRLRISLADLLGADLLRTGDELVWNRPRLNQAYHCTVTDDARLRLADGRVFTTPSGAAMAVADVVAYDGWHAWRVQAQGGIPLDDLRQKFLTLDA